MVYIMGEYIFKDNIYDECVAQDAIKNRRIWFNEEVNEQSCTKVIYLLNKLKKIDEVEGVKKPITLIQNSPGGICYQGLMLISKIQSMIKEGYEIITITGGMSASMSFLIGICGSKRLGMRYSSFLCHQPSGGVIDTGLKIKRVSEEIDRLWSISKEIIKEHTDMSDELLDNIYNTDRDYIIDSKKALELGIIDEIL